MQKLITHHFFCYPKHQNLNLLYKDIDSLKNRLFLSLSLQISPKEGMFLRLRKSKVGHFLGYLHKKNSTQISFLKKNNIKIGYQSNDKTLLFGFDKNNTPIEVYKKNNLAQWVKSPFLGYSIIEKYTEQEYFNKRVFIEKALQKRWKELNEGGELHGDFTHFNILISSEEKQTLVFIDKKKCTNSILFDHFYFYSYFIQCLEKCKTITPKEVLCIKRDLQKMIKNICKIKNIKQPLAQLDVKDAIGLSPLEKEKRKANFNDLFID